MLSRETVTKGTKRMISLPLSPLVISYLTRFYWENHCLKILRNTIALNSYLGFSALSKIFFWFVHREHTILLSRERVNQGTKRMISLPLSPLVISYLTRFYWENCCLTILGKTVALNSYLGLSAFSEKKFVWFV